MTTNELAAAAYVTPGYIRAIEVGAKPVNRVDLVDALADALGVTRDDLIDGNREIKPSPQDRAVALLEDVVRATRGVPVRFWGRVPADSVRWSESISEGRSVDVPLSWLGSHSPDQVFVIQASGDCLMRRGIITGSFVLCELANGRRPRSGQIVAVRIGDERTLKIWQEHDGRTQLVDGEGNVIVTLSGAEDIEVVGFYLAVWRNPEGTT